MIKQIFTWWNYQTVGTFLYTLFFGKLVGKDSFGNKYYISKKGKRWVIYNGEINASKIDSIGIHGFIIRQRTIHQKLKLINIFGKNHI